LIFFDDVDFIPIGSSEIRECYVWRCALADPGVAAHLVPQELGAGQLLHHGGGRRPGHRGPVPDVSEQIQWLGDTSYRQPQTPTPRSEGCGYKCLSAHSQRSRCLLSKDPDNFVNGT